MIVFRNYKQVSRIDETGAKLMRAELVSEHPVNLRSADDTPELAAYAAALAARKTPGWHFLRVESGTPEEDALARRQLQMATQEWERSARFG